MSSQGSAPTQSSSDPPKDQDNWELLRWVTKTMERQRIEKRERLRAAMKSSGIPLPAELVEQLVHLNHSDVCELLADHPGFKARERAVSYRSSLKVFESAVADLIKVIEGFEVAAEGEILSRRQSAKLEDIERAIQKELFAAANAAHSLVDHSRRLQKHLNLPDYADKIRECFSDDGLHEFVIAFRTVIHHLHMIKAGWRIENHFDKGKKASFTLNRDQIIIVIKQGRFSNKKRILACLSEAPNAIDLKRLFMVYRSRAAAFHAWFGVELASPRLIEVRDCERCFLESKNFGELTFWKAMLGNWLNWKKPPNPYDHLERYLTPEQLAEVYRLPMQSEQQVDRIIDFVDTHRACDSGLRKMAYRLFRLATPPALPET